MRKFGVFLLAVVSVGLWSACGGGAQTEEAAGQTDAPVESAAGKKVDPATAGSVSGKVAYAGEAPAGARLRMGADPVCDKAHSEPVYSQDLVVGDGGGLENAFVWVKAGLDGYTFDPPSGQVQLDQQGCVYVPHVLGVRTGQELQILNSDPTTHNINPTPQNNRDWNESQGPNAPPKVKTFARQEVMIPVKCNVHPWMKSYIGVVEHPYFAVTGSDGAYELKGLPPGQYTVEVWHEKLGPQEQQVTVAASGSATADFNYGG